MSESRKAVEDSVKEEGVSAMRSAGPGEVVIVRTRRMSDAKKLNGE